MKVLVFGATGGSGRAAIEHLLAEGHEVTAFTRQAFTTAPNDRLRQISGDVMLPSDVDKAVAGQDGVIVTLGIRENALRVRLFGPARTPLAVRSEGTRNIIQAMRKHGVRKIVVQTTYGVGDTRDRLGVVDRLFFELILKPQIVDTEKQNEDVATSDLDWVIAQPVHLTDAQSDAMPFASPAGEILNLKVSRNSVGRFLALSVQSSDYVGKSVALSGQA